MDIKKYQSGSILQVLRHDMREPNSGGKFSNESIRLELSSQNESLISRGKTAREINAYRKDLEKEVFSYNRKNLVKAIEVVIQLPRDCPPNQEERFYQECLNFWINRLPMGERCILMAQVHKDEIVKDRDGTRISHNHLHLMFSPCVKDTRHPGYEYKLCANDLTRKSILKSLHKELQDHITKSGLTATVYNGRGRGQGIKLSTDQLKLITQLTGLTIDRTMTAEDLSVLLNRTMDQEKEIRRLTTALQESTVKIGESLKSEFDLFAKYSDLSEKNRLLEKTISDLKHQLAAHTQNPPSTTGWGVDPAWGKSDPWHNQREHHR